MEPGRIRDHEARPAPGDIDPAVDPAGGCQLWKPHADFDPGSERFHGRVFRMGVGTDEFMIATIVTIAFLHSRHFFRLGDTVMQALIEWSDELSVGIQEIDEQHKLLLKMMNDLNEAIQGGWAREARDEILKNLVDYTKIHFTVEESLMRILGYPDYERHKQEHTRLINQLNDFLDEYHRNTAASSYDLLFFLRKWLTEHIKKSDKAYEKHFINMGVKRSWLKASWFERFFWS